MYIYIYIYTSLNLGAQGQIQHMKTNGATLSYVIKPFVSLYKNRICVYEQKHKYMALYGHIDPI